MLPAVITHEPQPRCGPDDVHICTRMGHGVRPPLSFKLSNITRCYAGRLPGAGRSAAAANMCVCGLGAAACSYQLVKLASYQLVKLVVIIITGDGMLPIQAIASTCCCRAVDPSLKQATRSSCRSRHEICSVAITALPLDPQHSVTTAVMTVTDA
jgi:hypothetical protein